MNQQIHMEKIKQRNLPTEFKKKVFSKFDGIERADLCSTKYITQ